MKKILTYLIISTSVFLLVSCDKPAPTQLVDDTNNELEVELLNKDFDQYSSSGADTSGITQDLTGITNLISVSGIKITSENRTRKLSLAQAMFFDKSKPIRYSNGKLLAYQTLIPGIIKFNGTQANIVQYRIWFRDMGFQKDTLIGGKYLLFNIENYGLPDPFYFNYNASVSFEFDPFGAGNNISFTIPTPQEIIGNVTLTGNKIDKNLEALLHWNPHGIKKVYVIIGLMRPNQVSSIPVYRIRTVDDGELRIPGRYLNQLPLENFEKIVFTFVRSFEKLEGSGNNEMFVSSQSIHSIVIDIP